MRKTLWWLLGICLLALTLRLVFVYLFRHLEPIGDPWWYHEVTKIFLETGQYTNPDGKLIAWKIPGYIYLLSAVYWLFGVKTLYMSLLQAVTGAVCTALVFMLARYYLSERWALVAAFMYAAHPVLLVYAPQLHTANIYALFVLAILVMTMHCMRNPTIRNAVLLSLLVGASMWVRQDLVVFPAILFAMLVFQRINWRRALTLTCVAAAVMFICLSPWIVRNYVLFDAFMPLSGNGKYTFAVMNDFTLSDGKHWGDYHRRPPGVGPGKEDTNYEIYWHENGMRIGLSYIAAHPVEWFKVKITAPYYLWYQGIVRQVGSSAGVNQVWKSMVLTMYGLVCLAILAVLVRAVSALRDGRALPGELLLVSMLLWWTLYYMLFFGITRYQIPIMSAVIICAVVGMTLLLSGPNVVTRLRERRRVAA